MVPMGTCRKSASDNCMLITWTECQMMLDNTRQTTLLISFAGPGNNTARKRRFTCKALRPTLQIRSCCTWSAHMLLQMYKYFSNFCLAVYLSVSVRASFSLSQEGRHPHVRGTLSSGTALPTKMGASADEITLRHILGLENRLLVIHKSSPSFSSQDLTNE